MKKKRVRSLYILRDSKNKYLPVAIGDADEICKFVNIKYKTTLFKNVTYGILLKGRYEIQKIENKES